MRLHAGEAPGPVGIEELQCELADLSAELRPVVCDPGAPGGVQQGRLAEVLRRLAELPSLGRLAKMGRGLVRREVHGDFGHPPRGNL